MERKAYSPLYYENLCRFLIELNQADKKHINWNWARLEWMIEHPYLDYDHLDSMALWFDQDKVVGSALYDMSFGEAFCGVLPEYEDLYPEVLDYAYNNLKDDNGLGISIADENLVEIELASLAGFCKAEQTENIMSIDLAKPLSVNLKEGYRFVAPESLPDSYEIQWVIWQGFDHGDDRAEFEANETKTEMKRKHFNPRLNIMVADETGKLGSYACLWYDPRTDYAYVEPVCVIPSFRGKGVAKAMIYELLNRAREMGAKKAYVISDTEFYQKLGFADERHFTFYWKKP